MHPQYRFWIKYSQGEPVPIDHSFVRVFDKHLALETVYDLMTAFRPMDHGNYVLLLPTSLDRSTVNLGSNCFANPEDINDRCLLNTCKLSELSTRGIGLSGREPLILKTKQEHSDETKWTMTTLTHSTFNSNGSFFFVSRQFVSGSGVKPDQDLILFRRSSFNDLFEFLENKVVQQGVHGWILGQPGIGKSTAALAYASSLNRSEWIVTWINLRKSSLPLLLTFNGNTKRMQKLTESDIINLDNFYKCESGPKKHIVFIDGYTLDELRHTKIVNYSQSWFEDNKDDRRLVVGSSMSSRGKTSYEFDEELNIKEFFMHSWKLQEYQEAVKNDDFYNSVASNLDASNVYHDADRSELINSKFYFAGGNSRYMFHFKTDMVIQSLKKAVEACNSLQVYKDGSAGPRSNAIINRLFSAYNESPCIISKYAAFELSIRLGPDLVTYLSEIMDPHSDPSMDGWLWEMRFLVSLRKGIALYDINDVETLWPASKVANVDLQNCDFPDFPDTGGVWLKPMRWNQGGYDCVYIEKSLGLIRFVQVTRGIQHDFKIQSFAHFLSLITASTNSFHITTLDIAYVVDYSKIQQFKINVTGGLLQAFGWRKYKENVRILCMKQS